MTVFESIKNKNIDGLAEWLDECCDSDYAPWWEWWDKNYCRKCESIEKRQSVYGYTLEYSYCEINNNCKFFKNMECVPNSKQIIKIWLESEEKV